MPLEKKDIASHFTRQFGAPPRWIVRARPSQPHRRAHRLQRRLRPSMAIDRAVWIALRPRERPSRVRPLDRLQRVGGVLPGRPGAAEGGLDRVPQGDGLGAARRRLPARRLGRRHGRRRAAGGRAVLVGGVGNGRRPAPWPPPPSLPWNPAAMAKLCQRAENKWVGVNCGIMDQMISAAGQAGCAMLLDCRDLSFQPAPLPSGVVVVVLDTSTRRGLVDSAYNERRRQCEQAAAFFGVTALRDVTMEEFHRSVRRTGRNHAPPRPARHRRKRPHGGRRRGDAPRRRRLAGQADGPKPREPARRLRSLQRSAGRHGRSAPPPTRPAMAPA